MMYERGVSRKIPHASVLTLAVVRALHVDLGLSVRDAVALAPQLLLAEPDGVHASGHLRVSLDRPALEREVDRRLRDALESAPTPRRGRPPGRTTVAR